MGLGHSLELHRAHKVVPCRHTYVNGNGAGAPLFSSPSNTVKVKRVPANLQRRLEGNPGAVGVGAPALAGLAGLVGNAAQLPTVREGRDTEGKLTLLRVGAGQNDLYRDIRACLPRSGRRPTGGVV